MIEPRYIERLIRAAVPDVLGVPVYVCFTSDHYALGDFLSGGSRGRSGRTFDLELMPHVDWQGRGAAILIDANQSDQQILGTAVHEFAHHLEQPFDLAEVDYAGIETARDIGSIAAG